MVNDNVGMTYGFSFWTLTVLVYDAHVMIFFLHEQSWNFDVWINVWMHDESMYELIFSFHKNEWCMYD